MLPLGTQKINGTTVLFYFVPFRWYPQSVSTLETVTRVIFLLSCGAVAVRSCTHRYFESSFSWRLFAIAWTATTLQAGSVLLGDRESVWWLKNVWAPGEFVVITLTIAAVIGCVRHATSARSVTPFQRFCFRFGTLALGMSLAGLAWLDHGFASWYWRCLVWRGQVWVCLMVAMLTVSLLGPRPTRVDVWIWLVVTLAHSICAPFAVAQENTRWAVGIVFRLVESVGCCAWVLLAGMSSREDRISRS